VKCQSSPEGSLPESDFPEAFNLVTNPTLDLPFPSDATSVSKSRHATDTQPSQSFCKFCNAPFVPRSSWQLYCSGKCRTAACRAANKEESSDTLVSKRLNQQAKEIERIQREARVTLRRQTKLERDAVKAAKKLNHQNFLATARELKRAKKINAQTFHAVAQETTANSKELSDALAQDINASNAKVVEQHKTWAEDTFDQGILSTTIAHTDKQNTRYER
jgi:hypothetical protein